VRGQEYFVKVLIINTEFYKGGAAQIAKTLFRSLNKDAGLECYFAYGRGEKIDDYKVFRFACQLEVYFHAFLTRITGLQGYGSWFSTKLLEKFIIKKKFDLINLHNIHGYYLNINFVNFLSKLKIPIVWTLHDNWPMTGRCACSYDCEKWKWGCGNCPDLSLYPKTYLDSTALIWKKKRKYFASGWNPIIVCPSQWLVDKVKKSYLNKYQVVVISNAVDTEVFKPKDKDIIRKKLKIPTKKRIILFVANDLRNKLKGTKYFFEALRYIKADNWMVVTLGKKININNNVKVNFEIRQMGYIKDKDKISEVYNSADIFCICSLYDNFPTTVLESLACGIPVVGFNSGGISEQVTEDCGILVNSKETKAFGRVLEKLLIDEELRKNFSVNCRSRALQNYSIKEFRDNYKKLYRRIQRDRSL